MLSKIPGFRGVFCRDTLPKIPNKEESGVMNFDLSTGGGTHWVAWICSGGSKGASPFTMYFDSFGLGLPDTIKAYLSKHVGKHYRSSSEIQDIKSDLCGYYCVDFIKECYNKDIDGMIDYIDDYQPWAGQNESELIKKLKKDGVLDMLK